MAGFWRIANSAEQAVRLARIAMCDRFVTDVLQIFLKDKCLILSWLQVLWHLCNRCITLKRKNWGSKKKNKKQQLKSYSIRHSSYPSQARSYKNHHRGDRIALVTVAATLQTATNSMSAEIKILLIVIINLFISLNRIRLKRYKKYIHQ